jgi:hypothetical protein
MTRYLVSSITEIPRASSQWELVTQDGETLLLTYEVGELTLCAWDASVESIRPGDQWSLICTRQREGLSILERVRENRIPLEDALAMLGDVISVSGYVASYEVTGR